MLDYTTVITTHPLLRKRIYDIVDTFGNFIIGDVEIDRTPFFLKNVLALVDEFVDFVFFCWIF